MSEVEGGGGVGGGFAWWGLPRVNSTAQLVSQRCNRKGNLGLIHLAPGLTAISFLPASPFYMPLGELRCCWSIGKVLGGAKQTIKMQLDFE